jgi:hypothetical protein
LLRDADRENYLQAAACLIKELRVPSSRMIQAGSAVDQFSIIVWQQMIDAALAEEKW